MGFFSSLTCRPRKWNAVMATNVKHAMTLVAMAGIASMWMQQKSLHGAFDEILIHYTYFQGQGGEG